MCFQIHVDIIGTNVRERAAFAGAIHGIDRHLEWVLSDDEVRSLVLFSRQVQCPCGFVTSSVQESRNEWKMDPLWTEPIAIGIERLFEQSERGIAVWAGFWGDKVKELRDQKLSVLLRDIRAGRIANCIKFRMKQ